MHVWRCHCLWLAKTENELGDQMGWVLESVGLNGLDWGDAPGASQDALSRRRPGFKVHAPRWGGVC